MAGLGVFGFPCKSYCFCFTLEKLAAQFCWCFLPLLEDRHSSNLWMPKGIMVKVVFTFMMSWGVNGAQWSVTQALAVYRCLITWVCCAFALYFLPEVFLRKSLTKKLHQLGMLK